MNPDLLYYIPGTKQNIRITLTISGKSLIKWRGLYSALKVNKFKIVPQRQRSSIENPWLPTTQTLTSKNAKKQKFHLSCQYMRRKAVPQGVMLYRYVFIDRLFYSDHLGMFITHRYSWVYSHFTDGQTEALRLNDLPKVTQGVCRKAGN